MADPNPHGCRAWRTYGVGRGNDGAASLQGGDDAGLGDGDALLLHGLVDAGSVLVIHLQEVQMGDACPNRYPVNTRSPTQG